MKWSYKIIKNEGEGLKGYGYSLEIMLDGVTVHHSGNYGSPEMARDWVRTYMEIQIEQHGLLEALGVQQL